MLNTEAIKIHVELVWIRLRTVFRLFLGLVGFAIIGVSMWYGALDGLAAREAHAMVGSPGMAGEVVGPAIAPWAGMFLVGMVLVWIAYR